MTSLLSAKKRAEEFAAVVDGGADPAGLRPELAELVGVVGSLRGEVLSGAHPVPRAAFTTMLREQLMAEALTSLAQDNVLTLPPRRKGSRERRLALVASSMVLVGGTAGMAAAAQNALPGEALYPIKRGLENAQAQLAADDGARGQDLLAAADSRLVEVQGLFDSSASLSQVPATIDDFTAQALEASGLLLDEYAETGDPAIIAELRAFAADNLDELQELAKTASAEHQDELAMAADALMTIDRQAEAACPTCTTGLESLEMPTLFLTAVEAKDAMEAVQRVQLYNDHPVITDDTKSTSKGGGGEDAKPPADEDDDVTVPQDTDGTEGTDDPESPHEPDSPEGPGLPVLPLEDIEADGPGGSTDTGGKDTGGQVKDVLPDELDPVVDTLLP